MAAAVLNPQDLFSATFFACEDGKRNDSATHQQYAHGGVTTSIYFMKRDDLHREEKPYAFRYATEEGILQSNMIMEKHDNITIENIRGRERSFSVEKNGFTVLTLPSPIPYQQFYDDKAVQRYLRALEILLKDYFKASKVEVFRYGLRKRHASFPISTGTSYEYDQPTSVAHVDTTPLESLEEVRRQHGADSDTTKDLLSKRVQWINVWKPLRGPLHDWPLCFCDTTSMNPNNDLEAADLLYPEFVTENCQVYHNPELRWYYLDGQGIDELIVFKQSDTDPSASPGVPHCAFYNPNVPAGEPPRESIEARALVFYD